MSRKLLLFQPYVDELGHFRFFFDLWRTHLTESGYEVTGLVGLSTSPETAPDSEYFVNPAKGRFTRILGTVKGLCHAFQLAADRNIPVIYIQDFELLALSAALFLKRRQVSNRRLVLHQHAGNFEVDRSESILLHLYRSLTRTLFRRLLLRPNVRIIANGRSIADGLTAYTGIGAPTVVASTWGTTPGTPVAPKEKNSFLFAGILRKDKNLELVLDTLGTLGAMDWSLVIAGRPMEYSEADIQELVRQSGIDPSRVEMHLRFIPDDEWATFFSRAEYVFIPYKAYNKSNSGPLIDALQYDCIPIVSDVGERGYLVRELGIGYAFDFAERSLINLLMSRLQPDSTNDEVLAAIQQVKSDFTWPKILRDLTENHRIFEPL